MDVTIDPDVLAADSMTLHDVDHAEIEEDGLLAVTFENGETETFAATITEVTK